VSESYMKLVKSNIRRSHELYPATINYMQRGINDLKDQILGDNPFKISLSYRLRDEAGEIKFRAYIWISHNDNPNLSQCLKVFKTLHDFENTPVESTIKELVTEAMKELSAHKINSEPKRFVSPQNQLKPFLTPAQEIGVN